MIQVSYFYYTDIYCGAMAEEDFLRLQKRASAYLDYITIQRASAAGSQEAVKLALCAVADVMHRFEQRQVRSEQNDGVSISYADSPAEDRAKALYDAAACYLSESGLLYRGVEADAVCQ